MTLPKDILDRIESEARNYAWRNYVSKADHPQAEFDNINTWPDDACYSYYSLLYYLNGDNPAQPVQGIFSATQLHTLQQENELLYKKLKDAFTEIGRLVTERDKENERLRKALTEIRSTFPATEKQAVQWARNSVKTANAALTAQPEADNQQNENV